MEIRSHHYARRDSGYTLIELLAVIGIMAMLAGVGIGLMRGTRNELERSTVMIRQYARSAWLRARQQQAPTILSIEKGEDEEAPDKLILRGLYLASEWNFDKNEQGSAMDVFGFGGRLEAGTIEANGRHGNCLVPDPEGGASALQVRLESESAFDFREGCLIQLDLYLDELSDCKVLELERMVEIGVDGSGFVEAQISLEGAGSQVGSRITLKAHQAISLKEWHRIQLRAQRGDFVLLVDGVEVDHIQKKGLPGELPARLFWNRQGFLKISDGGLPVQGRIDSIRLYGFEILKQDVIPPEVKIQASSSELHFTSEGRLDPYYHPELPRFLLSGMKGEEMVGFQNNGLVK